MSEKITKITKLISPIYTAENEFDRLQFTKDIEDKFDITEEDKTCGTCGSRIFYIRETIANKGLKRQEYPTTVDVCFVCAECGTYEGGIIIEKEFSKATQTESYKKVTKCR